MLQRKKAAVSGFLHYKRIEETSRSSEVSKQEA